MQIQTLPTHRPYILADDSRACPSCAKHCDEDIAGRTSALGTICVGCEAVWNGSEWNDATYTLPDPNRSAGHVCYSDDLTRELFAYCGELYIAPLSSVIALDTGNRFGRWECHDTAFYRNHLADYAGFESARCYL